MDDSKIPNVKRPKTSDEAKKSSVGKPKAVKQLKISKVLKVPWKF